MKFAAESTACRGVELQILLGVIKNYISSTEDFEDFSEILEDLMERYPFRISVKNPLWKSKLFLHILNKLVYEGKRTLDSVRVEEFFPGEKLNQKDNSKEAIQKTGLFLKDKRALFCEKKSEKLTAKCTKKIGRKMKQSAKKMPAKKTANLNR